LLEIRQKAVVLGDLLAGGDVAQLIARPVLGVSLWFTGKWPLSGSRTITAAPRGMRRTAKLPKP
jgi:hypothetical protein